MTPRRLLKVLLCPLLPCVQLFVAAPSTAATVNVAVATNFIKPMQAIAKQFGQTSGHKTQVSFGSSGKLYAQIRNGAPFEVFLSADQSTPAALEQQGLAVPGSRFTYAVGTLVLWSANPHRIQNNGDILRRNDFNKLAIANPKLAPYGRAAMEVLHRLRADGKIEEEQITTKIVQGQNIAQAYQFVSSANAEIGFIARSQIAENGAIPQGSSWVIPKDLYSPIKQDAVLLNSGKNNLAAKMLLEFIRSDEAKTIIESFGYSDD